MSTNQRDYAACKHIERQQPDFTVNQELADSISEGFDLLPVFEKTLYNNSFMKHSSLETNELLRCRWEEYKNVTGRVCTPFQFPDTRDIHFFLNACRFAPSETIHKRAHHRNHLTTGPGVDSRGQRPIPQELHMKRLGGYLNRKYPKRYPKDSKKTTREENN